MARLARVVAPGYPHHVVQRGNRRLPTFFCDDDYRLYLKLMCEWCEIFHVDIWAYCLMTNHVHLIAVPETEDGLRKAIGEAHRRYTVAVNRREGWTGHLWQGRFSSVVMDEPHLLTAARYVELNPVRAKMVAAAGQYPWSSAGAHLAGKDDGLVKVEPLLSMITDWEAFLEEPEQQADYDIFKATEKSGRPLGDVGFVDKLEILLGRSLKPMKRGPRRRGKNGE